MRIVTSMLQRVLGSGRVATAAFDVPVAADAMAPHLVRAGELPALDAATRAPGRWYHSTTDANLRSIVDAGMTTRRSGNGMYGAGLYFSSIPDAHYGAAMLSASVRVERPFVVHEGARFMDVGGFQRQVRPIVDRYVAAHPGEPALRGAELVRRALLDAGHDAVLVTRRPWEPQWLVALRDDSVRVVTAPS
jgi:hypothetical protein